MVIDHGNWSLYTPATPKMEELAKYHIMFAQRDNPEADDWYEYVASKPFGDTSVVMTVEHFNTGDMVQVATFDPTKLFPAAMRVIEETEYTGNDPFNDFRGLTYNPDTGEFGPPFVPPPPPPNLFEKQVLSALDAIVARLNRLESLNKLERRR
jgi:hypothetical protein